MSDIVKRLEEYRRDWICDDQLLIEAADLIERQREALRVAREAITDAREFTATTLARVGYGHRVSELVADWDYAIDAIDAAMKEGGE